MAVYCGILLNRVVFGCALVVYGCIWPHVVVYGCVIWLYMSVYACVAVFGCIWLYVAVYCFSGGGYVLKKYAHGFCLKSHEYILVYGC